MKGHIKGLIKDNMRQGTNVQFIEIKVLLSNKLLADHHWLNKKDPTHKNRLVEEDSLLGREDSLQEMKDHKEMKGLFQRPKIFIT